MALVLAGLLDQPEILVENAIKKLEHLSGWQGTDVKLLVEANNKARTKLAELGLDPDDTTGPELYHALLARFAKDEQELNLNPDELIQKITKAHNGYSVYSLKQSAAKELLRKHPPRKLMKQLNYRSVDSMIKRENVYELYAALPQLEANRWLNVFYKDLAKVTPSDFETQNISVVNMSDNRWKDLNRKSATSILPLLGAVIIWEQSVGGLSLSANIAKSVHELRAVSAYIKLRNVEANFGKNLVDVIQHGAKDPIHIKRLPVSWRTVFHHYGLRSANEHTEYFGPHLLHEDIMAHNPLKVLGNISPVFRWWQDLEYVAKKTEQGIVSLNLLDVAAAADRPYTQRSLDHFRNSLWHEFINRYFAHPSVEQHFMEQLEPQTISISDFRPVAAPEHDIRQMIVAGV